MDTSNNQSQKVSLGCGTLILIALIVMIFSNGGGYKDTARELKQLQAEVASLRQEVGALRHDLETRPPGR